MSLGPITAGAVGEVSTLAIGPVSAGAVVAIPSVTLGPITSGQVAAAPSLSTGPVFDHVALAAPTKTTGPTSDAFMGSLPTGVGTVYDHVVVKAPPTTTGPIFDHSVQAVIPPDWVFGPIYDSFTSPGVFSSVGPLTDAAPVMPAPSAVLNPDTPVPSPSRNTLAGSEVSFKSPGTYGLEQDPTTGKITGSKL